MHHKWQAHLWAKVGTLSMIMGSTLDSLLASSAGVGMLFLSVYIKCRRDSQIAEDLEDEKWIVENEINGTR